MLTSYTSDVLKKIEQGRTVNGVSYSEKNVPYQNFAHLFMEKVNNNPSKSFIKFLDHS